MRLLSLALAAGLLLPVAASAQTLRLDAPVGAPTADGAALAPDRTGFWLGARLQASGLSVEDSDETDSGGGLAVEAGYGFSRTLGVFLSLSGSSMAPDDGEDYVLGSAQLGVRANLAPGKALNPYLLVALDGQSAAFDVPGTSADLEVSGGGLGVALGLDYALSPSVALDARLSASGGRFNRISFDGDSTDNFDAFSYGVAHLGVGLTARL